MKHYSVSFTISISDNDSEQASINGINIHTLLDISGYTQEMKHEAFKAISEYMSYLVNKTS